MYKQSFAFTLIELLVVATIVSLLLSLLLPALNNAQAQAKSAVCKANLQQLGIALSLYQAEYLQELPIANETQNWPVILESKGYLGGKLKYPITQNYYGTILDCPAAPNVVPTKVADYIMNWHVHCLSALKKCDFICRAQAISFADGRYTPIRPAVYPYFPVAYRHRQKANFLFLDRHVEERGPLALDDSGVY